MAIDTGAYSYLFDPIFQVESIAGKPCVGGHIEVYKSGTDEKVITLNDWDGTCNPFRIPLGSDGRAVILVDIGYTYDAYIFDSFHNLICSRLNIIPLSNGDITVHGLSQVYHDSTTLSGKGTPDSPLTVINGGGGLSTVITEYPVIGNGSEEDPVTINDLTLLATDDTMTAYNAEVEGSNAIVLGVNGEWFNQATSGFQTKTEMSNYVTNQTFINNNNSLNTKIDTKLDTSVFSAVSGSFALSADVDSALAGKQDTLTDYTPDTWNTVTNKLDTTAFSEVSGSFLTAHQDISYLATKDELSSGLAEKQDVLTDYNPTTWNTVTNKLDTTAFSEVSGNFLTAHQSLEGYATESFVTGITDNKLDTSVYSSASGDFALKSEIPSVVGFMEESKLEYNADNLISGYNGSAFAGQASASDIVVFNDSNLPTSTQLDEAIAANKAICVIYQGRNYMFDRKTTSTYYFYGADAYSSYLYALTYNGTRWDRTQQVLAKQSWVNSQGFAKASDIPSLDGYATESWVNNQGFLTAHQSLEGYATESWVSSQGYAHSSDIPTNVSQLNNDAGYLTEHQSLTAYALKSELPVIGTIEV